MGDPGSEVVDALALSGVVERGIAIGVAMAPGVGVGLAPVGAAEIAVAAQDPAPILDAIETALRPRWTTWSPDTAHTFVTAGIRVATCWDVATTYRMLAGRWRGDPATSWANATGLDPATAPDRDVDLFTMGDRDAGHPDDPVRPDGHLRPDWVDGGWATTPARLARWAGLALEAARRQQAAVAALTDRPCAAAIARSESTTELLCAELAADGLPVDRSVAEAIIGGFVGPRTSTEAAAAAQRASRDAEVLRHARPGARFDLRNPGQVRSLLRWMGIEVPDTRAWRLEALRSDHPVVDALLTWRKAERMSTTFGYAWLDSRVGPDGRLRGEWTGSDGAAGRMTASAGLHNMPAELRPAVVAETGHMLVRADLGQVEPRVLAAISGDAALAKATGDTDLYAPVAERLGVERAIAKVAVLGAMYGQTTGHGAEAMAGLRAAYPVAVGYLEHAAKAAAAGVNLRTHGGRLVRTGGPDAILSGDRASRARAAAQGRYGRNAMVQGAAAELFKMWAVTVRARGAELGARIVLCLHDELLVHVPEANATAAADVVGRALREAAARWSPGTAVDFVADISVISRWSDAKA